MVASSHTLLLNVIGKKTKYLNDDKYFVYYVNDGVYGSFNCIYFDHNIPIVKPTNPTNPTNLTNPTDLTDQLYRSLIFGPTCDSMDVLFKLESYDDFNKKLNNILPELNIGDWLYVDNFGAYTIAAGCEFNGISRPKKIYYYKKT